MMPMPNQFFGRAAPAPMAFGKTVGGTGKPTAESMRRQKESEAEMLTRLHHLKRRRATEHTGRLEQAAAKLIRQVLAKIQNATPENFDALQADLERAQLENSGRLGSLSEAVKGEIEQALALARDNVANQLDARKLDALWREEMEIEKTAEQLRIGELLVAAQEDLNNGQSVVSQCVDHMAAASNAAAHTEAGAASLKLEIDSLLENAHKQLDATSEALMRKRASIGDG